MRKAQIPVLIKDNNFLLKNVFMLYLIDSAVVLNDETFYFDESKKYATTYRISLEFKDFRSRSLVDNAVKGGFLVVFDPSEKKVQETERLAKETGANLSDADISLVALALELKEKGTEVKVFTDDYSVQNLLLKLKIPFQSVIRGEVKKFKKFR